MNADELMVGDWILHKDNPIKVEEIICGGINPDWCCGELMSSISESEIKPIPLTAEILEKNGWYVPLLKSWWEHPDIAFWMKAYTDGTFELMIDEDSDISFCTIRFVHELQHALRLCGLKELADNFKV